MRRSVTGLVCVVALAVPLILGTASTGAASTQSLSANGQRSHLHAHLVTPRVELTVPVAQRSRPQLGSGSTVWFPGSFPTGTSDVSSVSCWSPGDCIGVGGSVLNENGGSATAVRYSNGVVSSMTAPNVPPNDFYWRSSALSCTSSTFCVVANGAENTTTPLFIFNGSSWLVQNFSERAQRYRDDGGVMRLEYVLRRSWLGNQQREHDSRSSGI